MTLVETAAPAFLFGLANAAHCGGMCGVFAFRAGGGGAAAPLRFASYAAGKTFTYVALGAVAGALGASALAALGDASPWLGLLTGAVLLFAGVRMILPRRGAVFEHAGSASPFVEAVRRARATGSAFLFGAATGALPCGVAYLAALQAATTGSPLRASLAMTAFGAGTIPVLAACAWLGQGFVARLGPARLRTAGAVLVLAAAVVTTWRAASPLLAEPGPDDASEGVPCCH